MTTASEQYFRWLVGLVDGGRANQYPSIFEVGWDMEFEYSVPHDRNRAQDGLDLRREFERVTSLVLTDLGPCRFLEFLVALSKHMEYILYNYDNPRGPDFWFWELMANLSLVKRNENNPLTVGGLDTNDSMEKNKEIIKYAFNCVIYRDYNKFGSGGLFPISNDIPDQRYVEVWYQMHAWIEENYHF